MKPLPATARPLGGAPPAPPFTRLPRPSRSRLRAERDRLFKEGVFDRALRVAGHLTDVDPSRESFFRLGFILRESGRARKSLKAFRDALRFKDGPAYLVPEIHLHLAHAYYVLGEYKRMGESLRRAYASRPRPRTDANLHLSFGNGYLSYRKYRQAHAEFVRAERVSPTAWYRGRSLINQAVALYYLRDLGAADRLAARAVRIFEKGGHAPDVANARSMRGTFCLDRGQYRRSLSTKLRAAEAYERLGDSFRHAEALHGAGYAALELADWEMARRQLDRAIALAAENGHRDALIVSHACRAIAAARLERFDQASADLAEAKRRLRGYRYWIGSFHVYRAQARIAAFFGNWAEARRWSRRAERLASRVGDFARVAEFRELRARAEAELGRRRAAFHARKGAALLRALLGARSGTVPASRLAASSLPVLLLGESGVGKTALALQIHRSGPRARRPCVVVPCEQLVFAGAEVAGHETGAWSGAPERTPGHAQRAATGTLVLDRLDELDPAEQRVLVPIVEGRVRPVGSAHERRLRYRVVATARDAGKIVPELRARLEGAVVSVPPLRERRGEIPALVRGLIGNRPITADALALLGAQPWKGNLPELKARVERLSALGKGPIGTGAVREALKSPIPRRAARREDLLRRMALALR